MSQFLQSVFTILARLDVWAVIDIVVVAAIIYGVFSLIKGTTAFSVLYGLLLLVLAVTLISSLPGLVMLNWLLRNSLPVLSIALLILFQPELRRAMERLGRFRSLVNNPLVTPHGVTSTRTIDNLASTCRRLSERRWGGLIVLERSTGLQEYAESGVNIDGAVSSEFLLTVFFPNSPLHDGAVIVRGDRVVAAGCLLPLSEGTDHYHGLGTRHRAGIGITEQTDALALIVSEETGIISLANNGRLVRNLDEARLRTALTLLYATQARESLSFADRLRMRSREVFSSNDEATPRPEPTASGQRPEQ